MKKPMLIIVGPSGAGKSTFVDKICEDYSLFEDIITYTTRAMRKGESEGNPYHFVSTEEFQRLISENFFVEWALVHDNHYGTSLKQMEEAWAKGHAVIMDVDVQGAKTYKSKFPEAVTVFILPPSIDELRQRVSLRDQGKTKNIELRMKNAEIEIKQAGDFDYQITNDEFPSAYDSLKKIIEENFETR